MINIIDERDWMILYDLNLDIEELKQYAHEQMKLQPARISNEADHSTALWWPIPHHPTLKTRLEEICELEDTGIHYLWNWYDGTGLNRHQDGIQVGQALIVILEGEFTIYVYGEDAAQKVGDKYVSNPDAVPIDSCRYGPGAIFALKNGHRMFHDGICHTESRLAIATLSAPFEKCHFRDYGTLNTWNKYPYFPHLSSKHI